MAGKQGSKLKLLAVLDILSHYSDDDHVLTANEICEKLEEFDIFAERKSIYADIENLRKFGFDVINTKSPKRGFFLGTRDFEIAEVRLLIDAVMAANFISTKKTAELLDKLFRLVSRSQAETIERQVFVENKLKCANEEIYYTIDTINRAIAECKKVEFKYIRRKLTKRLTTACEEKSFTVSPYALTWLNDRYYLICNNAKYDNLMHTRLDRMGKVTILDEKARSFTEVSKYRGTFDTADYTGKLFNMFSGEIKTIELRCSNSIIDEILDRFGSNVPLRADGDDHFVIKVNAAVSKGLVCWILQYGEDIKVKVPKSLAVEVKENAKSVVNLYENTPNES